MLGADKLLTGPVSKICAHPADPLLTREFVRVRPGSPNGIRTRVATLREWSDLRTVPLSSGFTAKDDTLRDVCG